MNALDSTPETKRECDECGKTVAKFSRVLNGHQYCATCYTRAFKRRLCPRCGNFARLPKDDLKAVCRKCQRNKPCARCGKADFKIGKLTPYGPACKACAPYFTDPELCEICGQPSRKLTRSIRLGLEHRVCPRCSRTGRGTCGACRRHRRLLRAPDGRMLCEPCLEHGEIPCPKCNAPMPAGHGKQCQNCYWDKLLEKRILINSSAFSTLGLAQSFEAFGQWLGGKVGGHKAALAIHHYLPFFMEIGLQWGNIPSYDVLLRHFGAQHLRRVLLAIRWMEEAGLIFVNVEAKEEDSERRRIVATLKKVPEASPERTILDGYYKSLQRAFQNGAITMRSVRLALSPAASLLLKARELEVMPPDRKALAAYLEVAPGQRAAISGFVRYLREVMEIEIVLPKFDAEKAKRNRGKQLETAMLELMQRGGQDHTFNRRWLSVALAYFYELPVAVGKNLSEEQVSINPDGSYVVDWNGETYWIPKVVPFYPKGLWLKKGLHGKA